MKAIELIRWRVMRTKTKSQTAHTFHAVGYVDAIDGPWISEAIKKYEPDSQVITTVSGEMIQLDGPSGGYCRSADTEFALWCNKHRVVDLVDVSSRYALKKKRKVRAA